MTNRGINIQKHLIVLSFEDKMSHVSQEYELALQLYRNFSGKSFKAFFPTHVKRGKEVVLVIYECEAFEMLPRPFNLKDNEFKCAFLAPAALADPKDPMITFSFFLTSSKEEAMHEHRKNILTNFEARKNKYKEEYTDQDVENKLKLAEFIPLQ